MPSLMSGDSCREGLDETERLLLDTRNDLPKMLLRYRMKRASHDAVGSLPVQVYSASYLPQNATQEICPQSS